MPADANVCPLLTHWTGTVVPPLSNIQVAAKCLPAAHGSGWAVDAAAEQQPTTAS